LHDSSRNLTLGTKWAFRNKLDKSKKVIRNKTRLVAQDYTQIEGIDFKEIFAPITGLKTYK